MLKILTYLVLLLPIFVKGIEVSGEFSLPNSSPDSNRYRPQFSGSEHLALGKDSYLQMILRPDGEDFVENFANQDIRVNFSAAVFPFTTANGLNLRTYGNLVASFGDFFAPLLEEDIICRQNDQTTQDAKIWKVFDQLWNNSAATGDYYNRIQQLLADELAAVNARTSSQRPYEIYSQMGDFRFFTDFIGSYLAQYLVAAVWNFDHFADNCAQSAYRYIHRRSMELARNAGGFILEVSNFTTAPVEVRKNALRHARDGLEKAYVLNAYADHILSDTFAAGHMRTPRTAIAQICLSPFDAGYAAKIMHDEDNRNGLWVKNDRGDVWKTFGDGMYFDDANAPARAIEKEALQISKDEIYDAFNGIANQFHALDLIPNMDYASEFDYLNICPMYQFINGKLHYRTTTINRPNVWLNANGFSDQVLSGAPGTTVNQSATTCDTYYYSEYHLLDCPLSFLSSLPGFKMLVEAPITHSFNTSDNNPITWTWTAAKDGEYIAGVSDDEAHLYAVIGVVIAFCVLLVIFIFCCCCTKRCSHRYCYGTTSSGHSSTEGENAKYQEKDKVTPIDKKAEPSTPPSPA